MDNFKNLYDLCINNSLTAPTDLSVGGHDASEEFRSGKAATAAYWAAQPSTKAVRTLAQLASDWSAL
mgnify:CR=1 FL=1